ncbi:hypothetical protein OI25_7215 [Paraburkholderia fungorum]|jgi:hypothetical protein|uniref:Uncharacterized protein n=1 Tax=Paraburkholderia fungorum TaxID=134537 RepID=A0AAP5V046_9BURK|nr:hypothetical protein [Paraburkholderia fungorum]AJZ56683.1 hypothetical protein OI25_7215 [Paraburkholderia fungorum]MDT8842637.1 hypothetical protein [Paraburkholderia fungorum]PRZ49199.1 hypothetical protein BX589_126108 [Paraburkholderia fungorum]
MSETLSAVIGDAFGLAGWPAGNVAGLALKKLLDARLGRARDILLAELSVGAISQAEAATDESVAIIYRYLRSAQEGAARLNLRLLAAVFTGQVKDGAIAADQFLYYADILASLKRDELIILGSLLRVSNEIGHDKPPRELQMRVLAELVPDPFKTVEDYSAAAGALQRTGLVASVLPGQNFGSGGGVIFKPTSLLSKLNDLAEIEGVLDRSNG